MTITYPLTSILDDGRRLEDESGDVPYIFCLPGACKDTKFQCEDPGNPACVTALVCLSDVFFYGPSGARRQLGDDDDDDKMACEDVTVDTDTVIFCLGLDVVEGEFVATWDKSMCGGVSCGSNELDTKCKKSRTFDCPSLDEGEGEGNGYSCGDACANLDDGPFVDGYLYGDSGLIVDSDAQACTSNFYATCIPEAICYADLYTPPGADDADGDSGGSDIPLAPASADAILAAMPTAGDAYVESKRLQNERMKEHMHVEIAIGLRRAWASLKNNTAWK